MVEEERGEMGRSTGKRHEREKGERNMPVRTVEQE